MKAKLYSTRSAWLTQYNALVAHFDLSADEKWCAEMRVGDGGDDDGKWVLALPESGHYKADNLVSGNIDYDSGWHDEPPIG